MQIFLTYIIAIGIIYIIIKNIKNEKEKTIIKELPNIKPEENFNNYYQTNKYVMTYTELKFYNKLKDTFKEKNLKYNIFPQVNLESIIESKYKNNQYRNKIKAKSIDFTIVSEKNCKIICCIELDDYTHNSYNRINRDSFINKLFKEVGIKLLRIDVSDNYNIENIINKIKEVA